MPYAVEVLADSPAGYWRLNDTSGTTAVDSCPSPHNGTYNGGVTLNQTGPLIEGSLAASFDAVDDYVSIADTAALRITGDLTLEAWVNPVDRSNYFMLVTKDSGSAPRPYEWRLETGSGSPTFNGAGGATSPPATGVWSHVAVAYTVGSSAVAHYLNGAANGTGGAGANVDAGNPVYIGLRNDLFGYFKGLIAEVAIYPSALSAVRISAHYTAGTTTPPALEKLWINRSPLQSVGS